eukprot:s5495_g9.t1
MLAVYPEEVANDKIIPYKDFGSTVCPRYHEGKNCNNRTNCPHFHPDFINDHWVVPDFICQQVVPGHLRVPELLLESTRSNLRLSSPIGVQYTAVISWIIMHTMGDFRRREVRKWRFGTHFTEYHDYEVWDRSIDADRVRSEYRRSQEVARMNDVEDSPEEVSLPVLNAKYECRCPQGNNRRFPKAFLDFLPAAIELTTPDAESIKLVYVDRGNDALVYRSEQYKGIVFKLCEDSLWRCSRKWTFLPPSQACI